jgi:uncharacterized heparinase superfamily protein
LTGLRSISTRLPTILRTLRWISPNQARAQLRHTLFGVQKPVHSTGPAPSLAIASPSTDYLAPAAHVRGLSSDRIELLATPFDLGGRPDWTTTEQGPLFAYHLHQHEYLRTGVFSPVDRAGRLLDWIERHPQGTGWDPHPISLRLLCWGKLLTTPGQLDLDEGQRQRVLSSMADQAETLSRGLEIRLQANHLLSNLISVVWASVLLEGKGTPRWRRCEALLIGEIDRQIHPDGGHEERSPMYHALLLENLLDLLNVCRAEPARASVALVEALEGAAARMIGALRVYSHPDGEIALFADSGFDMAAPPSQLIDYAVRLGIEDPSATRRATGSAVLPNSGYLRLEALGALVIASVAGPAPAHQPGHAHCDALSFEASIAERRLITDTGLFEYRAGARRDRARATASHATLQIDGQEQAEVWSAHRIGGRPEVELVGWDGESRAEASCRGWSRRDTIHRRTFEVGPNAITIIDEVEGPARRVRFCLPVDPNWRVELEGGARRAIATWTGEDSLRPRVEVEFDLPELFEWRCDRGAYYPSFGREVERDVLVGESDRVVRSTLHIRGVESRS